jgi:Reverse transcriptase (RNA-dependent DNA polymerase)
MGVGRIRLGQSKKIHNVDGTHNQGGEITHFCILKVKLGDKEREQKFYITDLGRDHIILGYTWLVEFDPKINWKDGAVEGQPCHITTANDNICYHLARKLAQNNQINKVSISQEWANKEKRHQEEVEIPDKYKRHTAVFSEEGAKHFPPERPEDMEIKLEEGAPKVINCSTFNLAAEESQAMKDFLDENLKKGYISQSNSPWSTPAFFIKKTGGGFRPIFDYRQVNNWTTKDVYPLPRIDNLFDQLHGTCLMTKFDVQDRYYNIRIKPQSHWIAAFKTPFGLYEPNVMPFGLTNAPAVFQRFMDRIFGHLKWCYPKYLHWYMDDILIATPDDKKLHEEIVHTVLDVLEKESLFLKAKKCHFEQEEVDFLGYFISKGTIKVDPSKRHGLEEWP